MADLTTLVGLTNDLIKPAIAAASTRAKIEEMKSWVYFGEGPSDQVAVVSTVNLGLPAAASIGDRAADVDETRPADALTKTTSYTPYRTNAAYSAPEMNRLMNAALSGNAAEYGEILADGIFKCFSRVLASIRAMITGALGTATVPDLSAGTDFLAASHTLSAGGPYANNGTLGLDTAALQTYVDAMTLEQDWLGEYTNAVPSVLIASSASKITAAVKSAYGSSALDANIGFGMKGVVLPGLGDFWALSSGPGRYGVRVDFRARGAAPGDVGGFPWVGEPYIDKSGRYIIPYGCDYACYATTYYGLFVSNGTT